MSFSPHGHISQLIQWIHESTPSIEVAGLSGSALAYHLSLMLKGLGKPCLIILPQARDSEALIRSLNFFLRSGDSGDGKSDIPIYDFPAYDLSPLTGLSPHREVVASRIESLYALLSKDNATVITSLEASLYRILPKESFLESLEYLEVGEEAERDTLVERLETIGYQRTSLVEERADYSVRGSVIDLFPPSNPLPVRMEFWGDHLESIRYFDPLSQRSKESLRELVILPASEIIMGKAAIRRARSMGRLPKGASEGMFFQGQEGWLNHFYPHLNTLFHYLPHDTLQILVNSDPLDPTVQKIHARFEKEVEKNRNRAAEVGEPFPEIEGLFITSDEFADRLSAHQRFFFNELDLERRDPVHKRLVFRDRFSLDVPLELRLEGKGKVSLAPLAERMSRWRDQGGRVVLVCRTLKQAQRLREILKNYGVHIDAPVSGWKDVPNTPGFSICLGRLSEGFSWPETGLYVVTEDEIFGAKRSRARSKDSRTAQGLSWSGFSQLKKGDLVVHEEHGIGRYGGLRKLEIAQKVNDFVIVEYADHDRLYIPADRVGILQKYIGAGDGNVRLDRLGGNAWSLQKQKARKSVRHIARQLIEIYALRKYRKGYSFSSPDSYFREFEATFEHEETPDQIKAIDDVLDDMISENPMDRLVCGDVGYGKTEVAIRAAFKANADGKQVALLVPTTVLAEQHFETFRKRMSPYGIRVEVVSRFKSRKEQTEILGRLRSGQVDILIGTHRILQKDVHFQNLGLLVIDEEQRFGVKQKEAIKKYRALVDVLAITATPVPRTLQLSMLGVRDLSIIETPPEERLAIRTHLIHYDEATIADAIQSELERDGQVFFVHNRVHTIDQIADRLRQIVPTARFAVAHGQMKEKQLEETMLAFLHKQVDVLVSSTIIESGLDIPSANTIIINEVDRLGLAQIYQLRGRVGRSKQKAYAYLLLSNGSKLSRDAEKRLKALMDFSQLGAGIHLAMHDLKIRGGGNILGYAQAGHISAMGYELYVKLIEQAVAELKGEMWQDEIDPEINIDLPAFLPNDYVVDTDMRLNLYRRLSMLDGPPGLADMEAEIKDRFGPLPHEVRNLMAIMSLRLFLKQTGISRLDAGSLGVTLAFSPTVQRRPEEWINLAERNRGCYQFLSENTLKINTGPLHFPDDLSKVRSAIENLPLMVEEQGTVGLAGS
jgi:transcription-repair coupling factor (superfamily II helicase)